MRRIFTQLKVCSLLALVTRITNIFLGSIASLECLTHLYFQKLSTFDVAEAIITKVTLCVFTLSP